jgi:hypothetical protein
MEQLHWQWNRPKQSTKNGGTESMTRESKTVDYMCKVGVLLEPCTQNKQVPSQSDACQLEFIYGIGPEGISPFEKAIFGKHIGDVELFPIAPNHKDQIFEHLAGGLGESRNLFAQSYLKITIKSILKADNREVIKAMAGTATGCGEDCACGCGSEH